VKFLKSGLRALFLRLEQVCEKFFGPGLNPLVHLGSLGWFLFWIVAFPAYPIARAGRKKAIAEPAQAARAAP